MQKLFIIILMTWITLTGVGVEIAAGTSAANPQLQFFENFPGHLGALNAGISDNTLSVHAVNIPLSISFNNVVVLLAKTDGPPSANTNEYSFGLYSLNGSTLSLANSASASTVFGGVNATSWLSFATSATQNITPGAWYFALLVNNSSGPNNALYGNSSINPANAIPGGFLMGRMTASTGAMPASIATSDLDITGSDATRQPYIIITA